MPAPRSIIHVDMDAFYASVEQLDRPELAGRPVIVGGAVERGVVAAASYEARRYGVRSAMPVREARRRCPHGVYLPVRMARYREVSAQIFAVFRDMTPLVEGLSLDEAFLDVTGSTRLFGSIEAMGRRLKDDVREATGLIASVGMAPNKFLAKLASDLGKPDGFVVVASGDIRSVLDPLPVRRIWGIGVRAGEALEAAGIRTVADLRRAQAGLLHPVLGRQAGHFQALARGEDERPVVPDEPEKSIGSEDTYPRDLGAPDALAERLLHHAEIVGRRLRRAGLRGRTVTVKIRRGDFRTYSRSRTLSEPIDGTDRIYTTARALFEQWRRDQPDVGVRLLGVTASNLTAGDQLALFEETGERRRRRIDEVVDAIRRQFGDGAVRRGRNLRR